MKNAAILFALCFQLLLSVAGFSQSNTGELQIQVQDAQGLALPSVTVLTSEANQVAETLPTDRTGKLDVRHLPFGHYSLIVRRDGFVTASDAVDIESSIPKHSIVTLQLAPANSSVTVHPVPTLLDPSRAGASYRIGKQQIENRAASLPGRGLVDLVNTQPGWLYEGNAVLHPRGSEYQTQFVVNGIPLTENRSPGFGTQLEAADVQSMTIYTAGIPAEFGRKLGGVIEVNTVRNAQPGLHGTAVLSGGSFATSDGYLFTQYGWGQSEKTAWELAPTEPIPTGMKIRQCCRISRTMRPAEISPDNTRGDFLLPIG